LDGAPAGVPATSRFPTCRYEAMNAMFLSKFIKEHREVEERGTAINQLRFATAEQKEEIKALIATSNRKFGERPISWK
jgi:hypothetical protein